MPSIIFHPTRDFYIEKYANKKPMTDMHYHVGYELYYPLEGEREYFVGDSHYKLARQDLLFIPSGMLHRTAGKGATRFLIYFSRSFVERFFRPDAINKLLPDAPFVFRAKDKTKERIQTLLADLLLAFNEQEHSKKEKEKDDLRLAGGLFHLLLLLATEENLYVPSTEQDRLSQVVRYINTNFATIGSLEEVASKFFVSKFHLCHMFKEHLQVSLVTYLNTIRIRAACKLLKDGGLSTAEVAAACGFHSASYFCKVFKDEKGVSPGKYLKNHEE